MLRSSYHKSLAKIEREFGYDATYLHELVDASESAAFKFFLFQPLAAHRQDVPKDAWFAAKLAGALSEDCGPCSQLVVDMALKARVSGATLAALVRGDMASAGDDAALGFRYGQAVATNAPDAVTLAEEVRDRFGDRGLVSLALVVTTARVFPTLKRGLGHGATCQKLVIGQVTVTVR